MAEQVGTATKVESQAEKAARRIAEARCPICGKPVLKPKDGGLGATCYEHQGKLETTALRLDKVPEGFIRMSKVCRELEKHGIPTGFIVKACGGDACTDPVLDPVFTVTYVGRGKWLNPEVLTKGLELLLKARSETPDRRTTEGKEKVSGKPATQVADTANALKAVVRK